MRGMAKYEGGIDEVWTHPQVQSNQIWRYDIPGGGGGGYKKINSHHPPPPYAEKTHCETPRMPAPRTSTESILYTDLVATSQKHRNCETVDGMEPFTFQ